MTTCLELGGIMYRNGKCWRKTELRLEEDRLIWATFHLQCQWDSPVNRRRREVGIHFWAWEGGQSWQRILESYAFVDRPPLSPATSSFPSASVVDT